MPAATVTLSESASGAIGIRTCRDAAARLIAVRPAPSAPASSAKRRGTPPHGHGKRRGVACGRQRPHRHALVHECAEYTGPRGSFGVRQSQRRAAGDRMALRYSGSPVPGPMSTGVDAKRVGRAKEARRRCRGCPRLRAPATGARHDELAPCARGAALADGQTAAVHVEPGDILHPRRRHHQHVKRLVARGEHFVERGVGRLGDQHRAGAIARLGQQAPDDQAAFRQEQPVAAANSASPTSRNSARRGSSMESGRANGTARS